MMLDNLIDANLKLAFTHLDTVTKENAESVDHGDTQRILELIEDIS